MPSLQLDIENALKSYLTASAIFVPPIDIHSSHAIDKAEEGTWLVITAEPPDWYSNGGYNANVLVRFQFASHAADPSDRPAVTVAHSERVGALIDHLSQQRFTAILLALNRPGRSWSGLGFDAWEEDGSEAGPNTETQLVTTLNYEFTVHLTA